MGQEFEPGKRLHFPWQYRKFFNGAESFRCQEFAVFRIPNTLGVFRLGITLKARGSSIERNRVKRRVREAFRTHQEVLGSFDYNVVVPTTVRMDHFFVGALWHSLLFHLSKTPSEWGSLFKPFHSRPRGSLKKTGVSQRSSKKSRPAGGKGDLGSLA